MRSVKQFTLVLVSLFLFNSQKIAAQNIEKQTPALQTQFQSHTQSFIYPYKDPWTSTLTFALLRPKNLNFKSKQMTMHPERDKLPFIGKTNKVSYGIFLAKDKTAPLIFINPGAGANGLSPASAYLAEILQENGFSVITLPSTFNFRFALSISRSGLPGHIQTDTEDLYLMMKNIYTEVYKNNNIKTKSVSLLGYSLGAKEAAFLNLIDQKEHTFNFKRIYFINPPIHLLSSLITLDSLFNIGLKWSDKFRTDLKTFVEGKLFKFVKKQPTIEDYSTLDTYFVWQNKPLPIPVKQWIIGASYRSTLRDLIYTSQIIKDLGIQKVPLTDEFRTKRYNEAMMFSFENYLNLFILPQIKKEYDIEPTEYLKSVEFQPAADIAKQTAITAIVHNSNDFLINEDDLPSIQNYSKESKVFDYGGHLGTIWVPDNINHMLDFFKPLID